MKKNKKNIIYNHKTEQWEIQQIHFILQIKHYVSIFSTKF